MRCIVVKLRLVAKKPSSKDYPKELKTIGDHLRKTRLDRGLSQSEVAQIIGVDTDTITCWELNRNVPTAKYAKRIIGFLGYVPLDWRKAPIHKQLYYARLVSGMTQRDVAERLGLDFTTIQFFEKAKRKPAANTEQHLVTFIRLVMGEP